MLWSWPLGFASALVPALLLTSACAGVVEAPYEEQASGGSSGMASGGSGGTGVSCTSPSPGTAPLRRLSNAEYRNSVTDLFATIAGISSLVASATREFPAEPES